MISRQLTLKPRWLSIRGSPINDFARRPSKPDRSAAVVRRSPRADSRTDRVFREEDSARTRQELQGVPQLEAQERIAGLIHCRRISRRRAEWADCLKRSARVK